MTLTELKRLAEEATPGRWYSRRSGTCGDWATYTVNIQATDRGAMRESDAAFIAAFNPEMAKKLIAAIDAADQLVQQLRDDEPHFGYFPIGSVTEYEHARAALTSEVAT